MEDLTRPIIKNVTRDERNVHLAVYPFFHNSINMMMHKGHYGEYFDEKLSEWKKELADKLWDNVPGISCLFFNNGEITIQHNGVLEDNDVIELATRVIQPYLETNIRIMTIDNSERIR